jgi:hypothetical protein
MAGGVSMRKYLGWVGQLVWLLSKAVLVAIFAQGLILLVDNAFHVHLPAVAANLMGGLPDAATLAFIIPGAIGVAGMLVWEYGPWRRAIATPKSTPALSHSTNATLPDMPIRELFLHIEPNILGDGEENPYLDIGRDILDRLAVGQLGGWGRRVGGNNVLTKIAPDDWAEAEWTFMFFGEEPAWREEVHARIEGNEYRDVTFKRSEVLAIWPTRRASPIDFSEWDAKETLELHQAAALWISKQPVLPMTEKVRDVYNRLCEELLDGKLRPLLEPEALARFDSLRNANQVLAALNMLKPSTSVYRSDLIRFARSAGKTPQFLFPEKRSSRHNAEGGRREAFRGRS